MAEYYTNSIGGRKKRRIKVQSGKSLALFLCDVVVMILMLLLIVSSFTTIICQYISPEKSGFLSVLAIGAPIIYLLDIVVMFYWIVRWRWYRAVAMIVVVVIGLFYVSRYYKLDFDRQYDISFKERRYTKIMTYNVCDGRAAGLSDYIAKHNPDILCVQEMYTGGDNWRTVADKYRTTDISASGSGGNHILSKYRIIRSGEVPNLPRRNGVWADIKIKDDTVRVVNLHLQSTSIRSNDITFLEQHGYISDTARDGKLRSIVGRLQENNIKRAAQALAVRDFVKSTPFKSVVCGDFNDVPLSYTYNIIAKPFSDTFSKSASGFAYTYDTKYALLRIDNILVSPVFEVVSYEVDNEVKFSDHYPVISRIKF